MEATRKRTNSVMTLWRSIRKREGVGKKLFWVWIAYQSIKGVITLSLIWVPLFLVWRQGL